jgi:hypothetical protein
MQINATLVSFEVDVQVAKNGGGTYKGCRLAYRDENGALKEKGFSDQAFKFIPQVKTTLMNLKVGEQFTAEVLKEGDYWNWKSVQAGGAPAQIADKDIPATGKSAPYQAPKSTYATAEERAQTQVYIVRQSTLTQAVALVAANAPYFKKERTPADVIAIAKEFESHVMGIHFDDGTLGGMKDDTGEVY